jgi:DNA-binding transcriptional ArsR family regulator
MRNLALKPQDVLVLLKMFVWKDRPYRLIDLADALGLSQGEVSVALERARAAGLLDSSKRKPIRSALAEFLVHGLKYVFPVSPGPIERGMPTAYSAPPLAKRIVSQSDEALVWPFAEGTVRGQTVSPLYESAPLAAQKDPKLYEWLVLVDALRLGRAREKNIAADEVRNRLVPAHA